VDRVASDVRPEVSFGRCFSFFRRGGPGRERFDNESLSFFPVLLRHLHENFLAGQFIGAGKHIDPRHKRGYAICIEHAPDCLSLYLGGVTRGAEHRCHSIAWSFHVSNIYQDGRLC